jgi:hypothetical protein
MTRMREFTLKPGDIIHFDYSFGITTSIKAENARI